MRRGFWGAWAQVSPALAPRFLLEASGPEAPRAGLVTPSCLPGAALGPGCGPGFTDSAGGDEETSVVSPLSWAGHPLLLKGQVAWSRGTGWRAPEAPC